MTTKQESKGRFGWLLPFLTTVLIGLTSWILKEVIALRVDVAVQANSQQATHDAVIDINRVLSSHSIMLGGHDVRLTRLETQTEVQRQKQ